MMAPGKGLSSTTSPTAAKPMWITLAVAALLGTSLSGQPPRVFPGLDVRVPIGPQPFVTSGATHLVYELHITNLSPRATTIDSVDVIDGSATGERVLLHLEGQPLKGAMLRPGPPPDDPVVLTGGRAAIVFMWVTLPAPGAVPTNVKHRLGLRMARPVAPTSAAPTQDGAAANDDAFTITGVDVPVSPQMPVAIGSPLEGDMWLAANGPDNTANHRRTLLAFAGEARIAQRFAIDWVRLFDDGRTFHGDPKDNASYRAFGASVLAVADGTVVDTVDGIPENVPDAVSRAVPITPATLGGNYILLDVGGRHYATYAHLQPGSLMVKKGDRVRRGQVLARLGNTGNSSEPHLHFQIADRTPAFDAEGVPYVFAAFDLVAKGELVTPLLQEIGASVGLDPDRLAGWKAAPAQRRRNELPLMNAIVTFPQRAR